MAHLYPALAFTNPIETPLQKAIYETLKSNGFRGYVSKAQAQELKTAFGLTDQELYFAMLPFSACYAYPTISKFYVGAIVEDLDGNFFFGGNQEYEGIYMQFTVHAEQCAINHAYVSGAKGVKSIIVNYSPCGQCRQFINELNTAKDLKIFLPQIPEGAPLSYYLPDSFGPSDLEIDERLLDNNTNCSYFPGVSLETVLETVRAESVHSYSPYSKSNCFVVVSTKDAHYVGRYIENAAYSPSFAPVLSALTQARVYGVNGDEDIVSIHLEEDPNTPLPLHNITKYFAENFGKKFTYSQISP